LIKKDLVKDPYPAKRITNPRDAGYDDIILSFKRFIDRRYQLARQQLDNPGPRPKPYKQNPTRQHQRPEPGDLPNGPTDVVIISRTRNSIKLEWKDNADNEAGHIVQRADIESAGKFRNHIPCPGRSETNAIDVHVGPGETYRYRVYSVFSTPNGYAGSKPSKVVVSAPPTKSGKK
jgi:hypothetical protein